MVKKKVLLIRLDKIGDLICTLPADQILDSQIYDTTWIVQKGLGSVVDLGEKKRTYIEINKNTPKNSRLLFRDFLKKNHFDIAVSFQCPWWINYELFKAGIKKRIGVVSQWHSFLFLNAGLRQKRSQALKHEFEYNLELVEKITGLNPDLEGYKNKSKIYFKIKKPTSSAVLANHKLPSSYIVVHPGMMGSALNWPEDKYISFIESLISKNENVVITGTASDEPYLKKIKSAYAKHDKVIWLQSKLSLQELVEVLYYAQKIIAPSTGVAHIAASLDKEIHGIYSPITVHHPKRWAPRGPQAHSHFPRVECPAQFKCLGDKCPSYNCMNQIQINLSEGL